MVASMGSMGSWACAAFADGAFHGAGGRGDTSSPPIEVLTAPDASPTFGVAVAAAGSWIAVGDDRTLEGVVEAGRVHLFQRDDRGARRSDTISGRDGRAFDRFGAAVALDEDRLLVGAPGPDGVGGGFAEVFRCEDGRWIAEATLEDEGVGPLDRFGASVAISGGLAVVAAPRRDVAGVDAGGVAIFSWNGSAWGEAVWLTAPDAAAGDRFGSSVATDGVRVVVGVVGDDDLGEKSGAAWVFRRAEKEWRAEAKLLPLHGAAREWFGHAVAIEGDHALVGAPRADSQGTTSGTVWSFRRDGGDWSAVSEVPARDGRPGDWFGFDLAVDGDVAIAGAPGREVAIEGLDRADLGDAVRLLRRGRRWWSTDRLGGGGDATVGLRGSAVAISDAALVLGHRPVEDGPMAPGEVWVVPRR